GSLRRTAVDWRSHLPPEISGRGTGWQDHPFSAPGSARGGIDVGTSGPARQRDELEGRIAQRSSPTRSRFAFPSELRRVIGLQFVVEDGEAVDGGSLGAEHEPAQGDGERAGGFGRADLRWGEISFGTHPDRDRLGESVAFCVISLEQLAGMLAARLQGGN